MTRKSRPNNRRGVAIVMVVGLLAILTLAAVSFSIAMRVERRGAANFRHSVQARHIVWSGIAQAINDIHASMDNGSDFYMYPQNAWNDKTVIASRQAVDPATGQPDIDSVRSHVLSLGTIGAIPYPLREDANDAHEQNCYWHPIKDEDGGVRGRYAYLVVDASGLLDANQVGGTNRLAGDSPAELQIGGNDGIFNQRRKHVRYESLAELEALNSELLDLVETNFAIYSFAIAGDRLNSSYEPEKKEDISGDSDALDAEPKRRKIKEAFEKAGVAAIESEFVLKNLIDYLDDDCIPHALDKPYTEAVPMLSEIAVTGQVVNVGGGNATVIGRLNIEWHYPFLNTSSNTFDLSAKIRLTVRNVTQGTSLGPVVGVQTGDSGFNANSDKEKYYVKYDFVATGGTLPADPGDALQITCEVQASVLRGTDPVDAAPFPDTAWISFAPPPISIAVPGGAPVGFGKSKEVIDPRFNYDAPLWYPHPTGNTLGSKNYWTDRYHTAKPDLDVGLAMHVSDAGKLKSVGELGHLLAGSRPINMWKTLRLFEAKRGAVTLGKHDLLEYLTMTNGARHGLVNINTPNEDVLRTVFKDCPIRFPDSGQKLSDAQVGAIVAGLKNAGDEFLDVGDIGLLSHMDWETILGDSSWTDITRESILTHACGLFTVRQNLFIVAVRAQAFAEGMGGTRGQILSASQAVAEIWRDPFRDPDSGKHNTFIRMFKYVEE